jgi:hypothetical protein
VSSRPSPRSILKRKRIQFDPLEPCDEKGEAVPPRRKQRLRESDYAFPKPPKDMDSMTDSEFDKWTESMSDTQYDEFERYMDDIEADSDADSVDGDEDDDTPVDNHGRSAEPWVRADMIGGQHSSKRLRSQRITDDDEEEPAPKRSRYLPKPIATNPNPTAPVGSRTNPVDLLGPDYFQQRGREGRKIGDKELKQLAAQLAYGPRHTPVYTGPKAETMTRVHEEAIRDSERRQMGKEIELFGGDCFRCGVIPCLSLLHITR